MGILMSYSMLKDEMKNMDKVINEDVRIISPSSSGKTNLSSATEEMFETKVVDTILQQDGNISSNNSTLTDEKSLISTDENLQEENPITDNDNRTKRNDEMNKIEKALRV